MKEYIQIGEKKYRVEANWNAITDFCSRKGIIDLARLDEISHVAVDDILPLMHCCIKEGERMDGRDFPLTEMELGGIVSAAKMGEFMRIYIQQSNPDIASQGVKKK